MSGQLEKQEFAVFEDDSADDSLVVREPRARQVGSLELRVGHAEFSAEGEEGFCKRKEPP